AVGEGAAWRTSEPALFQGAGRLDARSLGVAELNRARCALGDARLARETAGIEAALEAFLDVNLRFAGEPEGYEAALAVAEAARLLHDQARALAAYESALAVGEPGVKLEAWACDVYARAALGRAELARDAKAR